ncbi:MAG: tryptophan--tRNA ligase, partial [Bacteroidota bacterium]|nr:tryptophan--tRNA ligase [Bacteroidota bacterium]
SSAIIKKFKRAVTDSDNKIKFGKDNPAISNLLTIYSEFSGKPVEDIEKEYEGMGYGKFKADLGETVASKLGDLQKVFTEIRGNEERLNTIITEGNRTAGIIANEKINLVKERLGLN